MERNVDALLLNNIVESLKSSDAHSITSTCAFLETVVIYDFPAEAFLHQRELLICLLKLCQDPNSDVSDAACSCLDNVCRRLILHNKRKEKSCYMTVVKLISDNNSARDPGDGIEDSMLTFSNIALMIARACHQTLLKSAKPFDHILKQLNVAVELALNNESVAENVEFLQTLTSISSALRVSSRRNFATFLFLLAKAIRNFPLTSVSSDVVYEMYNGLLDASMTHYHPKLLETCVTVLQENRPLHDKYQKVSNLYKAFQNLAKFLKNSDQDYDLMPVMDLLKLDDGLTESLLPWIFKHLKEFGGKPAITMTLLLLSQNEPLLGQIYQLLAELASPVKSINIGPHIGDLFIDEGVVRAIAKGMCSESSSQAISVLAEKILTLVLKGKTWMNEDQWNCLVTTIVPKLILDIESIVLEFKLLAPVIWDMVNMSLLIPEEGDAPFTRINLNFILHFLIRNLSRDTAWREKSGLSLISLLCQQSQAHQLRPRISSIDPTSLSDCFQGDLSLTLESTAKFGVPTLTDTMRGLDGATLINARPYLIKLAIVLEDVDLHPHFVQSQGLKYLVEYLPKFLTVSSGEQCLQTLYSIVKSLLLVANSNPETKNELATNDDLILNLLRVTIVTKEDIITRRHCVALLRLLATEEITPPPEPEVYENIDSAGWSDMWPKAVVRWSVKFAFNAELSIPPSVHSIPSYLKLSPSEIEVGTSANDCALVEQALNQISNAEGYQDVSEALRLLREVLQRTDLLPEVFNLEWQEALETFFTVLPESINDEDAFASILEMLMLGVDQMKDIENVEDYALFDWICSIILDEKHTFWTLFQDQCLQFNKTEYSGHLLQSLIRFVTAVVCLMGSREALGSLSHILGFLCKSFELDNQSQVYQLNSLKLILDLAVHTAATILKWEPDSMNQSIIAGLLKHATGTLISFSSRSHSNKGRSVVQSCSQLINLLIALSRYCSSSSVPLPDQDWLIILLQHRDPAVKTAGLTTSTQLSRNVHISDEVAEAVLSLLFDAEESCSVIEQACILLSQHPARMTDQAIRQVVLIASSPRIGLNQSLLRALLLLLINCTHVQSAQAHLTAIVSDLLPVLPSILNDKDTNLDVKAAVLCLFCRLALLQPQVAVWLLSQFECVSTAVHSLFCDNENLVGEAAFFLTFLLETEGELSNKVFQVVLQAVPQLWDLFGFLIDRSPTNPAACRVLLFIQSVLTAAVKAERPLQIDPLYVEHFCQWILPNLPTKIDNTLRHSVLQAFGLLLSCSTPTDDTVKLTADFIIKELQLCAPHCSDKYLAVLLRFAHNFIVQHEGTEKELLQQNMCITLLEIWRTRSARETTANVLLHMISLEKILIGRDTSKEIRTLLKIMMEYLEEKETIISRQLTTIAEDDWTLVESIHDLMLSSISSLECRRILAKYKYWSNFAQTWHPVYLKRIINRQQHHVLTSLISLRARLLSCFTMHTEPTLPDLLESKAAQTLVDMVQQPYGAEHHALAILRNMAFHSTYKNPLLSASNVLPLFVRLLTEDSNDDDSMSSFVAVSALISLASNNQRVKSDIRSMTEAWFQRNPLVTKKESTPFQILCANLHKLIDV